MHHKIENLHTILAFFVAFSSFSYLHPGFYLFFIFHYCSYYYYHLLYMLVYSFFLRSDIMSVPLFELYINLVGSFADKMKWINSAFSIARFIHQKDTVYSLHLKPWSFSKRNWLVLSFSAVRRKILICELYIVK